MSPTYYVIAYLISSVAVNNIVGVLLYYLSPLFLYEWIKNQWLQTKIAKNTMYL